MTRKNILLVSFDDAVAPWPYRTAFQEPLQLPNLDRLCQVSTAFHAAYAQAPICGPSRASMMTGKLPHETGILNNGTFVFDRFPARDCWIHDLKEAGYFCASGGKVHHRPALEQTLHRQLYSDEPKQFSSDLRLPRDLRKRSRAFGGFRKGRGTVDGPDDAFFSDRQAADSAIDFLNRHDGAQPFYRELGFFSPHTPHITPARFKQMYDASNLKRPAAWKGYLADNSYVIAHIPENTDFRDEGYWQKSVRNYFSAYSHADYQLGRVLDALSASAHAENTVVVIVSDHGFHLGNRNLFRKTTLWEQSLNVPFIIFDPSQPQGQAIADPVALIDLGPTILDYAGLPHQGGAGRSLRPLMTGAQNPDRIIPSFYGNSVTIRRGDYRIIRYSDASWQLFDVRADYWQLHDLGADHPMFAPMRQALEDWAEACGYRFVAGAKQETDADDVND